MSKSDPNLLRALEGKLTRLVRSVVNKARHDPKFAGQLATILAVSETSTAPALQGGPKQSKFSPITFLHEHGEDGLRGELAYKTDDELRKVVRAEGIRKGREANSLERETLIEEIVNHSIRRLRQGASFLAKP